MKVLPLTASFAAVKVLVHFFDWEIWAFDALTAALFSAATFIVTIALSGTLADYRASETMPIQIANAIAAMGDTNTMLAASFPEYDRYPLEASLLGTIKAIIAWLQDGGSRQDIDQKIDEINVHLITILNLGGITPIVSKLQSERDKIRPIVQQMAIIRDTNFLTPVYVLLGIFLGGATIALLLIDAERFGENLTISSFLFTSFFYLLFLIRDLDNPFQYDGKSCIDVDLSSLISCRDRLQGIASNNPPGNNKFPESQQ